MVIVLYAKRFNQYAYEVRVNVQSNHKALENILRKPLGAAPSRLHTKLLQLQRYDLNVTHTTGKDPLIPDTLSQAVIQKQPMTIDDITDKKVV